MWKEIAAEIQNEGEVGLMVNNIRKSNPLDAITREVKKFTSKRMKSETDYAIIAKLEWLGALYPTNEGIFGVDANKGEILIEDFGFACIKSEMLEACLIAGAKKNKLGQSFKTGMFVKENPEIDFPRKRPIAELYNDPNFIDTRAAKLQGKTTIMATRAIFHEWKLNFTIKYNTEILSSSQILTALETAGEMIGIGTYRPKFGRFIVTNFSE